MRHNAVFRLRPDSDNGVFHGGLSGAGCGKCRSLQGQDFIVHRHCGGDSGGGAEDGVDAVAGLALEIISV